MEDVGSMLQIKKVTKRLLWYSVQVGLQEDRSRTIRVGNQVPDNDQRQG